MTITTTYRGTAREQWALAGIDLALGRITAAELLALGERLLRAEAIEANDDEIRRLRDEVYGLEQDLTDVEHERDDLEDKVRTLEKRIKALVNAADLTLGDWTNVKARDALRAAITQAERT